MQRPEGGVAQSHVLDRAAGAGVELDEVWALGRHVALDMVGPKRPALTINQTLTGDVDIGLIICAHASLRLRKKAHGVWLHLHELTTAQYRSSSYERSEGWTG